MTATHTVPTNRLDSRDLHELTVGEVMHTGVITCQPETPLRTVARLMATYRVHAVVVLPRHAGDVGHADTWGIVTDVDIARAGLDCDIDVVTAGKAAAGPVYCLPPGELLGRAIETMLADRLTHAVVVEGHTGRPVGVLSLHDVARVFAGQAGED